MSFPSLQIDKGAKVQREKVDEVRVLYRRRVWTIKHLGLLSLPHGPQRRLHPNALKRGRRGFAGVTKLRLRGWRDDPFDCWLLTSFPWSLRLCGFTHSFINSFTQHLLYILIYPFQQKEKKGYERRTFTCLCKSFKKQWYQLCVCVFFYFEDFQVFLI